MSSLILNKNLLESEQGDSVYTLAQARTATVITRLDADHNKDVMRFLMSSGLAGKSPSGEQTPSGEPSINLLSGIDLSGADLEGAYIQTKDVPRQVISNTELAQRTRSLKGTTMPSGQKYEDWLKSREEDGENGGAS